MNILNGGGGRGGVRNRYLIRWFSSNIDRLEIERFDKQAKTFRGESKALRSLNRLRIGFLRNNFASEKLERAKILEIGCGPGIMSEPLANLLGNGQLIAIDPSKEMILAAKNHQKNQSIDYRCSTLEEFHADAENRQRFDLAIVSEVLEHVPDPVRFLRLTTDLLEPENGAILVTTINRTLVSLAGAIFLAENFLKLVPRGTHDWNKFRSPAELQSILHECGFRTQSLHGMAYNFLSDRWSWTRSTACNYALFAIRH